MITFNKSPESDEGESHMDGRRGFKQKKQYVQMAWEVYLA